MRKSRLIIAAAVIALLSSCGDPSNQPDNKPVNPDNKTYIVFDNMRGICAVSVFDDYRRRDEDKIAAIPAGNSSGEIERMPGVSVPFYFSYSVSLKGINGFTLNYVPEIGKDQTAARIDAGVTTTITIPKLDETLSSPNILLSNNSYLLIQNNSSYSFQLHRGSSIIPPDNSSAPLVNSGERAQYTINPGAASPYQLLVGADYKAFSGSIVSFEAGRMYSFIFDGNVSLISEIEIKLENVAGVPQSGTSPETPGTPAVIASDGLLTLRWTAVQGAENYEVYAGTTQQPPAIPEKTVFGTTTVLTGLINKTVYYIWIKAVNSSGYSDFSPRVRGIPWSLDEIPAMPERLEIIPGINQLTVNWNECGGAASYEVYINTSPSAPSAPEITNIDKTSAVIKNLENNVIYYIWVRAVNGAGKSAYSPLEAGTPKIPTIAPAAPARPTLIVGSRELSISWQAVELAAAYEVWLGISDNSSQAVKQGGDITEDITETVITGLVNDTVYYVWIKAKNIVGTSGFSLAANAKPSAFAVAPQVPTAPLVTAGNRELSVSWHLVEGALSYEVWSGLTNNPANAEKHGADVSGASVTLTGLTNGTTYYLWVKAKNNTGASGFSPQASGTPSAYAATPSAPQTAPTVIAGTGQLTVNWQTAEGANSYEVWAGTSNNPTIATKRGDDVTGLSAVITSLTNGTVYYVWVKAKNTVGISGFSPMASGTPSAFYNTPQAPAAPSVSIGNGQITLTWAAVEGAVAYEIWMGTVNNSASAAKNGADVSASLSASINGLTNGTIYYIWVKAKNAVGTSGFSPAVSVKPIANASTPALISANGQLSVSWSAIAGADQYEVFCGTGINPPQTASQTINAPSVSATISGLTNGTMYNVWIRGKNATGTGAMSNSVSAKPVGNMGTVTLVSGNGELTASWSAVAGADQYEVYYSTANSIPGNSSQTVSTNTATISSLTNGTTYYLWVKPKNANGAGNASAAVSGTPMATPGSLTVSAGNQQIAVSWADVSGASSYEVYYSTTTTIPAVASFAVTELSKTITGLSNGTTYNLWVKAVNANGTSGASPMASGKPIGNMGTVTVTTGNGQLTAGWSEVAGADQYDVYYSTTSAIQGSPSQTVSTNTATISSLTNGTTYYVWVKPKNANGAGEASAAVSGTLMATPGSLTVSAGNQQIMVSWTTISGASSYEVYYSTTTTIPSTASFAVTELSKTITGMNNGTTYNFWVKAVNANGTSGASPMASAKPVGNMGTVRVSAGNGQLTASWSTVAGSDQYEVYYSTTNSIPGSPSQTVSTNTATISGLTNGTIYYVWIKPKNDKGTGSASTAVSGKPIGTPGAPTVSPAYKQQLLITWTAVAGADEYEVYCGTTTTPTTLLATTTRTMATITGLISGTTYSVRLRAKNANGVSSYGSSSSGVPNNIVPNTPGLYRGTEKIGDQNLANSLAYISTNAVSGDGFYIVLGSDEAASPKELNYYNKTVGITLLGYGGERTITLNANGSLFIINSGVTLTLDENITLVGRNANSASLVGVSSNATLLMNDGAKISVNNSGNSNGGGVNVTGTFTMNSGKIIGNTASSFGGGVYVSNGGTFTMDGGEISGNKVTSTSSSGGGGICTAGIAIIHDGIISNNTSGGGYGGGGIFVFGGTLTMYGGKISGNTSGRYGGGVYVYSNNATFTMHGGIISGNTAKEAGGGIEASNNCTFKKLPTSGGQNSGIIYGSEAVWVDADGIPLKNTGSNGHAVSSSSRYRNTTAEQTDYIDSTTGRGLSANGNPPFGQ